MINLSEQANSWLCEAQLACCSKNLLKLLDLDIPSVPVYDFRITFKVVSTKSMQNF